MTVQLAKQRWYLARYQQVNGKWETQVLVEKSWDALWKAREEEGRRGAGMRLFGALI